MGLPIFKNRVRQSSTTTGTGAFSLSATILSTYRGIAATLGTGNQGIFTAVNRSANEWETFLGTITSGSPDTLSRDTVIDGSSGAGTHVNFSAGTKDIWQSYDATLATILAPAVNAAIIHGTKPMIGGTSFDKYADVPSSGTTETNLTLWVVSANLLAFNGDKLTFQAGVNLVNSTSTKKLKLYFGTSGSPTNIFDSGPLTISAASAAILNAMIIRDSSTSIRYLAGCLLTGASTSDFAVTGKVTGLTLSNSQDFKLTGTATGIGAADGDLTQYISSGAFIPSS
jgi:hypothetical protein